MRSAPEDVFSGRWDRSEPCNEGSGFTYAVALTLVNLGAVESWLRSEVDSGRQEVEPPALPQGGRIVP